jgi:hypothetical protein
MATRAEFQRLSQLRQTEANELMALNYADGAFYLAGYAVECALKSAVCKTLGIDDFYEPFSAKSHGAKVKDDVLQKFKTHDFATLLVLSGLFYQFEADVQIDPALQNVQRIFDKQKWSEQYRYEAKNMKTKAEVQSYLTAVNYFLQWISRFW